MKVAIIGASISGLYLAWKLSEKGNEVFVFEKREKLTEKACSGLYSERIFEFIPQSKTLVRNEIHSCKIHFPKKTVTIIFRKKFFVFNRFELDNLLKTLAENSGAKIFFNKGISTSELEKVSIEFDRIIGCDGANSKVREFLKLPKPEFYLGIKGVEKRENFSDFVETWSTENGFYWKIPRGDETEWGVIEKPKIARKIFENISVGKQLEKIQSAVIPQGFILPKHEKITLCGDSTGLTKPWSGGGVIWTLMCADLLLKTFPNFLRYYKETKKKFLLNFIFSKLSKKVVYLFGFKFPLFLPQIYKIDGDFLI